MRWQSTGFLAVSLFLSFLISLPRYVLCQNSTAPETTAPHPQPPTPAESNLPAPTAPPIAANAPRMSSQTRLEIIHDFQTQLVYARTAFPMGTTGLRLSQGVITPNGEELRQDLALWGPSIKPGDPAQISWIQIKSDHIHFEFNGGPLRKKKWYERLEVSGAAPVTVTPGAKPPDDRANMHGSFLDLYFDKYVPEMTAEQLRDLLHPVLDFSAHSREQAYLGTVPPKVKEAILSHRVLVGMDREMVVYAKGKPPKKVRERDGEIEYEEWIYGEPPTDVDFVRFVGDEVVRIETMKVDGEKIVRTEKEVILPQREKDKEAKKEEEQRPANAPSLRRPGETSDDIPKPPAGVPSMPVPPPDIPPPTPNGPGIVAGQ